MKALHTARLKAELCEDGVSTVGGMAELEARLAEHGDGWTVDVKTEEKAEVKAKIKVEANTGAGGTCPRSAKVNEAPTHPTAAQQAVKAAALRRLGLSEDMEKPMREAPKEGMFGRSPRPDPPGRPAFGYRCDYRCGFSGDFKAVADHERKDRTPATMADEAAAYRALALAGAAAKPTKVTHAM